MERSGHSGWKSGARRWECVRHETIPITGLYITELNKVGMGSGKVLALVRGWG